MATKKKKDYRIGYAPAGWDECFHCGKFVSPEELADQATRKSLCGKCQGIKRTRSRIRSEGKRFVSTGFQFPAPEVLTAMPQLSHYRDRSIKWNESLSDVLFYLADNVTGLASWEKDEVAMKAVKSLMNLARIVGLIRFDKDSKLWSGQLHTEA